MSGIYRINIDQQFAEIGVNAVPARLNISQQHPEMSITTESPKMEIERHNPSFKINRKRINAESGLKGTQDLTRDYRDRGRSGAMKGTRTGVDDGNFLGDHAKKPGDRVGKLARAKTMSAIIRKKQMNIGLMPKSQPEVIWDKGSLRINWSKHSVVIDWDGEYMPQVTIDPKSSIEVYLRTEPYFKVKIEEGVDPSMPGRLVDRAI